MVDNETLKNVEYWIRLAISNAHANANAILILFGNKSDDADNRAVGSEDIINLALKHNIKYIEVSAKNGYGVKECFQLGTYEWLSNELGYIT